MPPRARVVQVVSEHCTSLSLQALETATFPTGPCQFAAPNCSVAGAFRWLRACMPNLGNALQPGGLMPWAKGRARPFRGHVACAVCSISWLRSRAVATVLWRCVHTARGSVKPLASPSNRVWVSREEHARELLLGSAAFLQRVVLAKLRAVQQRNCCAQRPGPCARQCAARARARKHLLTCPCAHDM